MRFLLVFNKKTTPEWASCYYDYGTMKRLIGICRKATSIQANIMDMTGQNSDHLLDDSQNSENNPIAEAHRKELYQEANEIIYGIAK